MVEKTRLPPIPAELTANTPDPTTKIVQRPDGKITIHSVRNGVEGHLEFNSDGSYKHHSNTGSIVEFSANNHLMYQKGGLTMTVDNNGDVRLSGHHRVNIDHDAHIEVAKNASIAVNGMAEVHSTGHVKITAADFYFGATKGSIVFNAARDIEMTATKGRLTVHTSGVQTFTTDSGDFHVDTAGQFDINSAMDAKIVTQQNLSTTSQQATTIKSKGADVSALSDGGDIITKGNKTKIQGGGPTSPPTTFI